MLSAEKWIEVQGFPRVSRAKHVEPDRLRQEVKVGFRAYSGPIPQVRGSTDYPVAELIPTRGWGGIYAISAGNVFRGVRTKSRALPEQGPKNRDEIRIKLQWGECNGHFGGTAWNARERRGLIWPRTSEKMF